MVTESDRLAFRAQICPPLPTMSDAASLLSSRKSDHLDLAISGDVGFRRTNLLEEITLVHCALPELSWDSIDMESTLVGVQVRTPLLIAAMTGGNNRAGQVNLQLAEVAERGGYAIGLGSQRAMIESGKLDREKGKSYQLRSIAPSVPIFGNLGVVQAQSSPTELVEEMVQFVGANALCLHMNPAQEMIQPEGDRDFRGCLAAIGRLARELSVPVIVKETGCGISRSLAEQLVQQGVQHIDIAGAGGTSWVGVETRRTHGSQQKSGELFWDWGLPTAASLLQVKECSFQTVVASGGIKNGLDAARAIALGAHGVAIARPVLQALDSEGIDGAYGYLKQVEKDLRTALLLTGCANLEALRRAPRLLGSQLQAWTQV